MEVDSDANSRFLGRTLNFLNWFQALPGATFHKDIAIEDLRERNAGRGISDTLFQYPPVLRYIFTDSKHSRQSRY